MNLICPHCQSPVEGAEPASGDVICSSCGSNIHASASSTVAWAGPESLRPLGSSSCCSSWAQAGSALSTRAVTPSWIASSPLRCRVPTACRAAAAARSVFSAKRRTAAQLHHQRRAHIEIGQADGVRRVRICRGITLRTFLERGDAATPAHYDRRRGDALQMP